MAASPTLELREERGVRLAIEGCGHGTLHAIYASIAQACKIKDWPGIDLLIIGGDFQSVRNAFDLNCVAMPAKYREMCDFHEYYSGARRAPYLTVFVGGNHEASNYLFELYYGGWVAENIYYIGAANVLRLGPLRIAGLSGIWKAYSYRKPHYERLPYNEGDLKSIYHVREIDARKLLQVRTQVDVGISHDWPRGVEWKGDWKRLFRIKEHLEEDARGGQLGSVAAKLVLERLRPRWWFSAHLHCKFAAVVRHDVAGGALEEAVKSQPVGEPAPVRAAGVMNEDEIDLDLDDEEDTKPVPTEPVPTASTTNGDKPKTKNADEIDLELEDDEDGVAPIAPGQGMDGVELPVPPAPTSQPLPPKPEPKPVVSEEARAALPDSFRRPAPNLTPSVHPPDITNKTTHFLALDKCLPNRDFLQLLPVPTEQSAALERPLALTYDREWLAITRAFALHEPLLLGDPKFHSPYPKSETEYQALIITERAWIDEHFASDADLVVPDNFERTAPVYDGGDFRDPRYSQEGGGLKEYSNPQTSRFCEKLEIPNPFDVSEEERLARMQAGPKLDLDGDRRGGRGRGRGGFGGGGGRGRGGGRGGGRGRGGRGRGRG